MQPHEQAAAGGVGDVADQPIAAGAASVAEIVAAHRLGLRGETAREIGGGVLAWRRTSIRRASADAHERIALDQPREDRFARLAARLGGRGTAIGTKKRSFQAMISLKRP